MTHPFPVGSKVFFLEGGRTRQGVVTDAESIEGLRFVVIKLDNVDPPQSVKLPLSSVNAVTVPQ
ncbi:hypothetical protein FKP32DRAFT_1681571 [Trametes sanguinea]|nr:hypothetical protein FKP32DRAFT_1681571 [Trametes sanguinea]